MLMQIVPSFWTIKIDAIGKIDWVFQTVSRYPLSIFNRLFQFVLTFFLPYAFINFYPAQVLISSGEVTSGIGLIKYMSFPIGMLFFAFAYFLWCKALKKYGSAGS